MCRRQLYTTPEQNLAPLSSSSQLPPGHLQTPNITTLNQSLRDEVCVPPVIIQDNLHLNFIHILLLFTLLKFYSHLFRFYNIHSLLHQHNSRQPAQHRCNILQYSICSPKCSYPQKIMDLPLMLLYIKQLLITNGNSV